ncbi:hypothetical protein GCM10007904_30740 [Oharaeibacter diazotrophicus]|nr:hypothetical protein GCM10007904_30740 [Oharaeibacter diazotrophicus]
MRIAKASGFAKPLSTPICHFGTDGRRIGFTDRPSAAENMGFRMPRIKVADREIALPRSRAARMTLGWGLILLGFLGFLPILGFWMVPAGAAVLSVDMPVMRRLRRRTELWTARRLAAWRADRSGTPPDPIDGRRPE